MYPSILPMLGAALAFTACAAEPSAQASGADLRVVVKVVQPTSDALVVARRVAASSGVAASPTASVSPQWHGMLLHCGGPADCERALERLRADSVHFLAVERDQRSQPLSPRT